MARVCACAPKATRRKRIASKSQPCRAGWQIATAMPPVRGAPADFRGQRLRRAGRPPVRVGRFLARALQVSGVPHEFVVAGALPGFDGERLLADAQRICEAQVAFWHGRGRRAQPPFANYLFALNTVEDGRGGLEHRASTALQAAGAACRRRRHGAAAEPYLDLLGLISHEYFHAWNVKRLKPAEFARCWTTRARTTPQLLWFFEGFTSYYDDLMLLRAGLIDAAAYLGLLAKAVEQRARHAGPTGAQPGAGQLRRLDQVLPQRREHAQHRR